MHDEARLQAERQELHGRRRVKHVRFESKHPDFHRLIPEDTFVECIASGFVNSEGPVWMKDHLLFTDAPRNRILRWRPLPEGPEVTTYRFPSGFPLDRPATVGQPGAMGLTVDRSGRLIACETGNRRVTRTEPDGRISVLASHYRGKALNRPNDLIARSDGSIYFTDPAYRLPTPTEPRELDVQGVYRVAPDGSVHLVLDDFSFPNGLALSPDERILYVADSDRKHIRAFDVAKDGSCSNGRLFGDMQASEPGVPDGMKVDQKGNIYCGGGGGLWVFSPGGDHLGRLVLPDWPRNLAWGDSDWRTLYVTAGTSVYRLRLPGAGVPVW